MRTATSLWVNQKLPKPVEDISEILSGSIDSSNKVFTTSKAYSAIDVKINGVSIFEFTKTNDTTITLDEAPLNTGGMVDVVSAYYSVKN